MVSITTMILSAFVSFLNAFLSWGGEVAQLPFGIDAMLVTASGFLRQFVLLIPPIGIIVVGLVTVITWKLALKFIAMIPIIRGILHK